MRQSQLGNQQREAATCSDARPTPPVGVPRTIERTNGAEGGGGVYTMSMDTFLHPTSSPALKLSAAAQQYQLVKGSLDDTGASGVSSYVIAVIM